MNKGITPQFYLSRLERRQHTKAVSGRDWTKVYEVHKLQMTKYSEIGKYKFLHFLKKK